MPKKGIDWFCDVCGKKCFFHKCIDNEHTYLCWEHKWNIENPAESAVPDNLPIGESSSQDSLLQFKGE